MQSEGLEVEYFCGCRRVMTTDCRCLRRYTLPQRLSACGRDLFLFCAGGLVIGLVVFGVMS
jgi:hypothetical protein